MIDRMTHKGARMMAMLDPELWSYWQGWLSTHNVNMATDSIIVIEFHRRYLRLTQLHKSEDLPPHIKARCPDHPQPPDIYKVDTHSPDAEPCLIIRRIALNPDNPTPRGVLPYARTYG